MKRHATALTAVAPALAVAACCWARAAGSNMNIEPCGIHDEAAWAARFPEADRFLFLR